ncbi:hypothetical protein K7432_005111 [Basidiobolus ranarum]|uniref:HSF-type DNA-binding domain-containing protein n=1 Tax=Basidiobolus ranarum TaxID=34480 RepID=A0ABR2W3M5_9FUNG
MLAENDFSDIIFWEQSGDTFIIQDTKKLASKVLPQYYETSKFTSFSRQLNEQIYGFYRVSDRRKIKLSSDSSAIVYAHQHFKRDEPDSYYLIQRMSRPYYKVSSKCLAPKAQVAASQVLLPSPLSSASSINTRPIFQHELETKHMNAPLDSCLNCSVLREKIITLENVINYYTSIHYGVSMLDSTNYERSPIAWTTEATSSEATWSSEISVTLTSPTEPSFSYKQYHPSPHSSIRPDPDPQPDSYLASLSGFSLFSI